MQTALKEIYTREPGEINYNDGLIEHDNTLETFIQKVKMILNTDPGEVLGFPGFGAGLNAMLFDLGAKEDDIKERIYNQILEYCAESEYFKTQIDTTFFKGVSRDILLVDITINGTKEFGLLLK